ncbi:MAG: tetratricopeptide repeat protein [Patescibacteria group bacterium]
MAKIRKDIKILRYLEIKSKINPWLENKIQRIRSLRERQAYRSAKRWGAPAGVALILFLILYSFFLPKDKFQLARERVLKNPNDLEAHLILAEEFLKNNELDKAEKELLAAQQIQQSSNLTIEQSRVLGLSSRLEELYLKYQEENPQELKKLIEKWEKIVSETPSFRDGYLKLSLYYFKLGQTEKAQENLQKALELDPNYEETRKLENLIK